jgi:L-aminopeptidase/D-esterase-like protein
LNESITAIEGLRVGHAQLSRRRTGCTVVLLPPSAEVAVDARGGYPGTYDTNSIEVGKKFLSKHAIFLTGGDVFGLDCAIGVRKFLLERGTASLKGAGKLPGIVGANIYDLNFAETEDVRYEKLGHRACAAASTSPVDEGNVGAGMGATVGKFRGPELASKGGCGTAARTLSNGLTVGAIVITNSFGNVVDPETGTTVAGSRGAKGEFVAFDGFVEEYLRLRMRPGNTTIGVVATNARLSHEQLIKVVQLAHNGLAMSIQPVHTLMDGDTIFSTSTNTWDAGANAIDPVVDVVGYLASKCLARAVVRSVKLARSLGGLPSCTDWVSGR